MNQISPSSPPISDWLTGRCLLILGLARQGKALARFAAGRGAKVIVSDLRSAETLAPVMAELTDVPIHYVLGEHPQSLLDEADVLAISGGVPADAPFVQAARERGLVITNDSQEFLRRAVGPTIGITGSAGKSTTTSLVGAMGKASGRPTWVGGNLGFPLIEHVAEMSADDIVVQELSSFQLEIWTRSPHVAAILNVTPNHLDRHKTMAVYQAAKANILNFQSADDIAILPAEGLEPLFDSVRGRLRTFSATQRVDDGACVHNGNVVLCDTDGERVVCPVSDIRLRGSHNVLNVLAACVLADTVGVSIDAMRSAIQSFAGIAHRLELVATVNDVQYVNDSIATAPERALAAIRSFHEPLVLLAGGRDKDLDWEPWAEVVNARCKSVVLFGELGPMVAKKLDGEGVEVIVTASLEQAVAAAKASAEAGDVVLLSPGGTSFDAYRDFAARGEHFRYIVRKPDIVRKSDIVRQFDDGTNVS